jgi:F0F1-type ATP synthase delta subunit
MKVPRQRIAKTFANKALSQGVSKRLAKELAAYLLQERRIADLNSILRDVQAEWAEAGYVDVVATSAHELNDSIRSEIKAEVKQLYPQAKQIIINEIRDPEVIGGVRLNLPNRQFDLSIEAKLNKFKQLTLAGKE